jgi:hypothetical protein
MNNNDLKHFKCWFTDYVAGFYTEDSSYNIPIRVKEEHTDRVCRNMTMLGRALGLSDSDMLLAETTALFHDIGRFRQYALYGTFNDRRSENHARMGLRQLAAHEVLSVCSQSERRLIATAIAYHNAAFLPQNTDEKTRFYMGLIRDADKLDIWRVFIGYYRQEAKIPTPLAEFNLSDAPSCSLPVIQALNQQRFVKIQQVQTLNDLKLLQISWVFDLNFKPSFQAVLRRNYIDQIEATLPRSTAVAEAVQKARNYVQKHA